MKLLTQTLKAQLIENGKKQESVRGTPQEIDFWPVVKLFTPDANGVWLLTEIDPENPDIAFGLCDLGLGYPELGSVSLAELESVRGPMGLGVERDLHVEFHHPLSVYADAARKNQTITLDPSELARASDPRMDPDYQRKVGDFVGREVIQNVSLLVSKVAAGDEEFFEMFRAFDANQALELVNEALGDDAERREEIEDEHDLDTPDGVMRAMFDLDLEVEDAQCEVYEHWIVTDWLATRLEEKGESIERDFHGLTIWGRCTTGQAIKMDHVICTIFDENQ